MINLYEEYKKHSYSELKEMFCNAKSKEEQDFYIAISNFNLQTAQRKLIEEENNRVAE